MGSETHRSKKRNNSLNHTLKLSKGRSHMERCPHHQLHWGLTVKGTRACKVSQQVQVLAAKPNDLSSIPGIHNVEGENELLQVLWLRHASPGMGVHACVCAHTPYTHIVSKYNKKLFVRIKNQNIGLMSKLSVLHWQIKKSTNIKAKSLPHFPSRRHDLKWNAQQSFKGHLFRLDEFYWCMPWKKRNEPLGLSVI